MSELILTLNAGSSSLKFALFRAGLADAPAHLRGSLTGIGAEPRLKAKDEEGRIVFEQEWPEGAGPGDAGAAMQAIVARLSQAAEGEKVIAVGHRVVHGGLSHVEPVFVSDALVADLERLNPLAPLHQPHNLAGIAAARAAFPQARQVACFDTAFHRRHPFVNDTFALPRALYAEGVRRYGFHGLSYEYVAARVAQDRPDLAAGRVVIAHLGNGASMCAIRDGRSIGSTMGFSALDGLPMGTRCGQIDPGVLLYLMSAHGMDAAAISDLLYKQSGLKGLSGLSHDMRLLLASESREAGEAIDYFVFRVRREIGAMAAVLGGLDALVFTGGIGENAVPIRARICEALDWLGLALDAARNEEGRGDIAAPESRVRVLVVPTDEERRIAGHVRRLLEKAV
ncbi:MAG: acetate/propionate family kinase [Hyphomicrobiaceae bacterium]|nr:acetate/propionate family kinase [Hyphomicrobiaceae bacterium]